MLYLSCEFIHSFIPPIMIMCLPCARKQSKLKKGYTGSGRRDTQDLRSSHSWKMWNNCYSVAEVVSGSLQPHGLQHANLPCPSLSPGVWWNSCPLVIPSNHLILCHLLLLLPSIFPSIRVFSNESFASGDQSIGVSALASVLPMNIQSWFILGLTGLISLQSKIV